MKIWCISWQKSYFENLSAVFFNKTPKPDMLKTLFFAQTFHSLCLRKRINFASIFLETLKLQYRKILEETHSQGIFILIPQL